MGSSDTRSVDDPSPSPGSPRPRCSIIIPVYNRASLTLQCLNLIFSQATSSPDFEVIVVDDASTDITRRVLATFGDRLQVLTNPKNEGFALSCNRGAERAVGEFLVFLNNDTMPQLGWLRELVTYADNHKEATIVGSKLLYPNNTIQHAGVTICQDRLPRHLYVGFASAHPAVNRSRRVQVVTGACLLMRREAFWQANGFATEFLNGYEDVDLCLRVGRLGGEVHYCHTSVLYHLESVSDGRFVQIARNDQLYRQRWQARVQPDDLQFLVDDGFLNIDHSDPFQIRIDVSPPLLAVRSPEHLDQMEKLLADRSRLVHKLLRESIQGTVSAHELELSQAVAGDLRLSRQLPEGVLTPPTQPSVISIGQPKKLAAGSAGRLVSLIMPVKNGANQLRENLPRLVSQRGVGEIELIAVDSGSDDDTVEILRQFGASIIRIDPRTYNHGITRNLAARYAQGHVYVFLNQSTRPANDEWLTNLIRPLQSDASVAGVCSRVIPLPGADYLVNKDGIRDLSGSTERSIRAASVHEMDSMTHHQLRVLINFHTVSAAIRPQVLDRIPFRKVTTIGEDIQWAKEVLQAGFKIQHEPTSIILHSHAYSYFEILQRNVDDGIANREIVGRTLFDSEIVPMITYMVRDDWQHLANACQLTGDELEKWQHIAFFRRSAQTVGQWLGVNRDLIRGEFPSFFSLTTQIMAGVKGTHTSNATRA